MYASTLKFIKNQIHNEQIYVNEGKCALVSAFQRVKALVHTHT